MNLFWQLPTKFQRSYCKTVVDLHCSRWWSPRESTESDNKKERNSLCTSTSVICTIPHLHSKNGYCTHSCSVPLTAPVSVISVSPPRNWYRQFVMAGQQPVLKSFYHWLLQVSVSLSSVSTTRASTLEFSIACILALTNQTLLLSRARQNCDVMTNPQPRLFFFTCWMSTEMQSVRSTESLP